MPLERYGRVGVAMLVVAVVSAGCQSERRVPYAPSARPGDGSSGGGGDGEPDPGGSGGTNAETVDGGTSTPPDDPTVTPTPGDPPGAGETWMEMGCETFDATRVYLEVQTSSTRETSALVELGGDGKHCIEFDKGMRPIIRPTTGKLVFGLSHLDGGYSVWEFVPDAMTWNPDDEVWEFPSMDDWNANDDKVDTTVCDPRGVLDPMKIEPDTGRIIFRCAGQDTLRGWFAEGGEAVLGEGFELLALGAAGRKLASATPDSTTPVIIDSAGMELPVVGVSLAPPFALRASGEGFRLARKALSGDDLELYQIGKTGQATLVGTYAPAPPGQQLNPAPMYVQYALDADDNLYAFGRDMATISTDTVIKLVLAPGTSEVVYDEDDEPMQDFTATPPAINYQIRNADGVSNTFVTGP